MAARRRANIHEVQGFRGQQRINAVVPSCIGAGRAKHLPAACDSVRGSDDPDVATRPPPGQMPFFGDIAESYERTLQHALPAQLRPNFWAIAPSDSSRMPMPRIASSSLITSGGLMRMTCEYDMVMSPRSNASWNSARVMLLSSGSLVVRSATIS